MQRSYIEKGDTLSIYRRETRSLSPLHREGVWLLSIKKSGDSLLFIEMESAFSLQRRETLSPLRRDGVCLLHIVKRDTLFSSYRRNITPPYKEEADSFSI